MPKWLSAAFALFLSLQVFGARGKAVDKLLTRYFYSFQATTPRFDLQPPNPPLTVELISTLSFSYRQPNVWSKTEPVIPGRLGKPNCIPGPKPDLALSIFH